MASGARRKSEKENFWRRMIRGQTGSGRLIRAWCDQHAVTDAACGAHARRKFYEARTSDAAASTPALAYIRLLYDVEDEACEQFAEQGEVAKRDEGAEQGAAAGQGELAERDEGTERGTPAERDEVVERGAVVERRTCTDHAETTCSGVVERDAVAERRSRSAIRHPLRREHSVPRLEQFRTWLQSQQAEHGGPPPPKSPMGQAITYQPVAKGDRHLAAGSF